MSATSTPQPPRLAVQAFWLTAAKFLAAAMSIAVPLILVRVMPQIEYGIFKEAFLFAATASSVATFGVGMSAFYFVPRYPERGGQIALNILVYNFVVGWIPLLILLFYPQILRSLFRTDALEPLAVLLGFLVLLMLAGSLLQQISIALQDVRYSTIFIVGSQVLRAIAVAGAALWFGSVKSIVIAVLLNQMVAIAVLFWYLEGRFPRFWAHFEWQFFKKQLAYALPYGAFGLLWVIQKDVDNYFVSASLGPKDYAIYAVGWIDVPLLTLLLESVVSVMIIRISSLQKQGRKADIRYLTAAATNRLAAIQLPLFAMLFVAGHDLIVLFFTKRYEQSANIFLVSICLLPLGVFLVDPVVRAYQELRRFVLGVRICIFVSLLSALGPVIHHFGMLGAAAVAVTMRYLEFWIIAWRAAKAVETSRDDLPLYAGLFKVMATVAVAGVVAYAARNLIRPSLLVPRILIVGGCIAAIYLPAMFVLRLPGWESVTKERLLFHLRATLGKLRSASA